MKIPKKFQLNTEDFKIYFDNDKKTHVCENIETGEKTNIGVLGIFMQMGILEQIKEDKIDERISILSQRIDDLENRFSTATKNINGISSGVPEEQIPSEQEEEPMKPEGKKKKPKSDIKEQVMKKALEQISEEKDEQEATDVTPETEEEIENWMDI